MDPQNQGQQSRRASREVVYLRPLTSQAITQTLEMYPRIHSRSRLMETAIAWYLDCVRRFGIDANWHPPIPTITEDLSSDSSSGSPRTPQRPPHTRSNP